MSGPKGYGYTVVSQEELDRREIADIKGRCGQMRAQIQAAMAEMEALGYQANLVQLSEPDAENLAGWRKHVEAVSKEVGSVNQQLMAIRVKSCQQQIKSLMESTSSLITTALVENPGAEEAAASINPTDKKMADSVMAAVELIGSILDDDVRDVLAAQAQSVLKVMASDPAKCKSMITALQADVQEARRAQKAAQRLRGDIDALRVELGGLEPEDHSVLSMRLDSVRSLAELDSLRREIVVRREAQRASQDRRFVAEQTAEALRDLGYEVGDDFVVQAGAGNPSVVLPPDAQGFGLEMRFLPNSERLLTHVVSFGDADQAHGMSVESTTCQDLDTVSQELARRGVQVACFHQKGVGEVPITQIEEPALATPVTKKVAKKRRRRTTSAKERGI
jgi:hypothetical protein